MDARGGHVAARAARAGWTSGLLERDRELDALSDLLRRATRGQGGALFIEGAAGLGKSHLLRWAREHAPQLGMGILAARASETERDASFAVVVQLLDTWLAHASTQERESVLRGAAALALPLLDQGHWEERSPAERPALEPLLHGLFWLVANIAAQRPLLVCLDDVHWADPGSRRFLLRLLTRIEELPIALVLTSRPRSQETRELRAEMGQEPSARPLTLRPLSDDAVTELLATAYGQPVAERFAQACARVTSGNPFLVRALIRALEQDRIDPVDAQAERVEQLSPSDVGPQAMVTISRLGDEAVRLACAAAVVAEGTDLPTLGRLAGLDPASTAEAADALVAVEVLATVTPVSFAHPLVRAALYQEIPQARRERLHENAAELLFAQRASAEAVSAHLVRTATSPGDWAAVALREGASAALERGNPQAALRYLNRALREPLTPAQRGELLLVLGTAAARVGDEHAEAWLAEALTLVPQALDKAHVYRLLGSVLYRSGQTRDAAHAFEAGLAFTDPSVPEHESLVRDLHAGFFSAASLDPELAPRALEHLQPVIDATAGGETPAERAALAALAAHTAVFGDLKHDATALALRAWGGGRLLVDEGPDGPAWSLVTGALCWSDALEAALEVCATVVDAARERGSLMAYATASYCAQLPALLAGRVTEARAHGEAALEGIALGWTRYAVPLASTHSRTLIAQGELEAAERSLAILDREGDAGTLDVAPGLVARGQVRFLTGRHAEALADFLAAGEVVRSVGAFLPSAIPWRAGAAAAAARLGDKDLAHALADEQLAMARLGEVPSHLAQALRIKALLSENDAALALLEEAVAAAAGSEALLELWRCQLQLGAALRRAGDRTRARDVLQQLLQDAHRAGARLIEQRAVEELRVAGARPRRMQFSGLDALTASERRIAEMAAQGMGNREIAQALFLTTRTIEGHLYNVYKKLGIGSRRELPAALAEDTPTRS